MKTANLKKTKLCKKEDVTKNKTDFVMLPREILMDERLSCKAKCLVAHMIDRHNLSAKNNLTDSHGYVYFYMTFEEMMKLIGVKTRDSVSKVLKELYAIGILDRIKSAVRGTANRYYLHDLFKTYCAPAAESAGEGTGVPAGAPEMERSEFAEELPEDIPEFETAEDAPLDYATQKVKLTQKFVSDRLEKLSKLEQLAYTNEHLDKYCNAVKIKEFYLRPLHRQDKLVAAVDALREVMGRILSSKSRNCTKISGVLVQNSELKEICRNLNEEDFQRIIHTCAQTEKFGSVEKYLRTLIYNTRIDRLKDFEGIVCG